MVLGIIGAMDVEVELLKAHLDGARVTRVGGMEFSEGRLGGADAIVVRCGVGSDGCPYFEVEDNGIGIPDEDLPHVFDRFYRVDKMRSREVGGTGLGLSIVKDTIENRGGSIQAGHGAGGVGTVFTVTLPLAQEEELCEE